jgi:hypothetical protein
MAKILRKKIMNPTVTLMDVEAPLIAAKAQPGQFVIVCANADGERIPLTIADGDFEKAYQIITEHNSLPVICGRVFPAPGISQRGVIALQFSKCFTVKAAS